MCNDYRQSRVRVRLRTPDGQDAGWFEWDVTPREEIRPRDTASIIRLRDGQPTAEQMEWGFINPVDGNPLTNAKSETAAVKKTWRDALRAARCLIPGDGYYEWMTLEGRKKWKHLLALPGDEPFFFAGLYDGAGRFAMMTTAPKGAAALIHDRMPVILRPEWVWPWLDIASVLSSEAALASHRYEDVLATPLGARPATQGDLFSAT